MSENKNCEDDITSRKFIYDSFYNEAERVSHRTDWFLIFNAILFEAFLAHEIDFEIKIILGLLGVLINYIWLFNGIRSWKILALLGLEMQNEKEMGSSFTETYKRVFAARKEVNWIYGWARPAPSFSILIPALCMISWIIIFYITTSNCYFLLAVILMLIIPVITKLIGPGPGLSKENPPEDKNEV